MLTTFGGAGAATRHVLDMSVVSWAVSVTRRPEAVSGTSQPLCVSSKG